MARISVAVVCAILLTGAVVATTQAVREESKCGDETLIWKPCEDETKACYETSYKGIGGRVWFQVDFSPEQPFYFKLDDRSFQNWVSSAERARNGLCRLLVETSEKPLDLETGDKELRRALGLP